MSRKWNSAYRAPTGSRCLDTRRRQGQPIISSSNHGGLAMNMPTEVDNGEDGRRRSPDGRRRLWEYQYRTECRRRRRGCLTQIWEYGRRRGCQNDLFDGKITGMGNDAWCGQDSFCSGTTCTVRSALLRCFASQYHFDLSE